MVETQNFKDQIKENPLDSALREVYADYLEESGQTEESIKQRNIAVLLKGPYVVDPKEFEPKILLCRSLMGYDGKKVKLVCVDEIGKDGNYNVWDEGSCVFREFLTFDRNFPPESTTIEVHHSIFCGKDMGITILGEPENILELLPDGKNLFEQNESLSWALLVFRPWQWHVFSGMTGRCCKIVQ